MLSNSHLKFIASALIYESSINKNKKIQLIRFIEGASYNQLSIFVNDFRVSKDEEISEAFVVPAMLVLAAMSSAKLVYDRVFSNAARYCADKGENTREERKKCIDDFKIRANRAKLTALRREMPKCRQTNNIKKCQNTFMKHIKRIEKDIEKIRRS